MHQIPPAVSLQAQSIFFILVEEEECKLAPIWKLPPEIEFLPRSWVSHRKHLPKRDGQRWRMQGSVAPNFTRVSRGSLTLFGFFQDASGNETSNTTERKPCSPFLPGCSWVSPLDSFPALSLFMATSIALSFRHTSEIVRVRFQAVAIKWVIIFFLVEVTCLQSVKAPPLWSTIKPGTPAHAYPSASRVLGHKQRLLMTNMKHAKHNLHHPLLWHPPLLIFLVIFFNNWLWFWILL